MLKTNIYPWTEYPLCNIDLKETNNDYLLTTIRHSHNADDKRTKTAAMLVNEDKKYVMENNILVKGYEHLDKDKLPRFKEFKNTVIEHAERAVIYAAFTIGLQNKKLIMYSPWVACVDCARAIILSGIGKVVTLDTAKVYKISTWEKSRLLGIKMMRKAGITVEEVDPSEYSGETLFMGGNLITL